MEGASNIPAPQRGTTSPPDAFEVYRGMFRSFLANQGATVPLESLASRVGVSKGNTFLVEWPGDVQWRTGKWLRIADATRRPLFDVVRTFEVEEALSGWWRERIRHPPTPPGASMEYRLHALAWRITTPGEPDACRVAYLHFDQSPRRLDDPSADRCFSYMESAWDTAQLYDPSHRVAFYTAFRVVSSTHGFSTVLHLLQPNGDVVAHRVPTSPTSAIFESQEGLMLGRITRLARSDDFAPEPIERVEVTGRIAPLVPLFLSIVGWLRDILALDAKRRTGPSPPPSV